VVNGLFHVIDGRPLGDESFAGLLLGHEVTPRAQADDLNAHGSNGNARYWQLGSRGQSSTVGGRIWERIGQHPGRRQAIGTLEDMSSGRVTVIVDGVAVAVRPGETVFDTIMRGGFRIPYACRRGRCAACKVQLISGQVVYTTSVPRQLFSDEERAAGICLSCTALPMGDVHVRLDKTTPSGHATPQDFQR
jgi:CDP-4-dehydro-6-deoxyglucose reductase